MAKCLPSTLLGFFLFNAHTQTHDMINYRVLFFLPLFLSSMYFCRILLLSLSSKTHIYRNLSLWTYCKLRKAIYRRVGFSIYTYARSCVRTHTVNNYVLFLFFLHIYISLFLLSVVVDIIYCC